MEQCSNSQVSTKVGIILLLIGAVTVITSIALMVGNVVTIPLDVIFWINPFTAILLGLLFISIGITFCVYAYCRNSHFNGITLRIHGT
ncbi:MAG: hypothetical protein LBG86_00105 [Puniceicoccales bacterium]|nr:hypothetical protein [Puniceicoccales bacterium]